MLPVCLTHPCIASFCVTTIHIHSPVHLLHSYVFRFRRPTVRDIEISVVLNRKGVSEIDDVSNCKYLATADVVRSDMKNKDPRYRSSSEEINDACIHKITKNGGCVVDK